MNNRIFGDPAQTADNAHHKNKNKETTVSRMVIHNHHAQR